MQGYPSSLPPYTRSYPVPSLLSAIELCLIEEYGTQISHPKALLFEMMSPLLYPFYLFKQSCI